MWVVEHCDKDFFYFLTFEKLYNKSLECFRVEHASCRRLSTTINVYICAQAKLLSVLLLSDTTVGVVDQSTAAKRKAESGHITLNLGFLFYSRASIQIRFSSLENTNTHHNAFFMQQLIWP